MGLSNLGFYFFTPKKFCRTQIFSAIYGLNWLKLCQTSNWGFGKLSFKFESNPSLDSRESACPMQYLMEKYTNINYKAGLWYSTVCILYRKIMRPASWSPWCAFTWTCNAISERWALPQRWQSCLPSSLAGILGLTLTTFCLSTAWCDWCNSSMCLLIRYADGAVYSHSEIGHPWTARLFLGGPRHSSSIEADSPWFLTIDTSEDSHRALVTTSLEQSWPSRAASKLFFSAFILQAIRLINVIRSSVPGNFMILVKSSSKSE